MNGHYGDIMRLIPVPPVWWDENAVPRYCEFKPNEVSNIYASEVVLMAIKCQGCGEPFKVAMSHAYLDEAVNPNNTSFRTRAGHLHYGDPPRNDCCDAGPSMNSESVKILEFWVNEDPLHEWTRHPEFEIDLEEFG